VAKHHRDAMALIKNGQWDASHTLIQQFDDNLARVIHGYLHKLEGDASNAAYWYQLAGETDPGLDPAEELVELGKRAADAN